MLKRIRDEKTEDGFTLIELMVVVLIIAILIAIAIPTFLGAREGAQDRGAQTNLRNAVTAAKVIFADDGDYNTITNDQAGVDLLESVEPNLVWSSSAGTNATNEVSFVVTGTGASSSFTAVAYSDSGTCFYIRDTGNVGTEYVSVDDADGLCPLTPAGTPTWATSADAGW